MREITLREYRQSEPIWLSAAQVRALQSSLPSINVAPTGNADGEYRPDARFDRWRNGIRRYCR